MIYLHHYPASLFSEKVRVLLGYLDLSWRSVIIPNIMPRPLLMPLSGGYRKTPCLQIGANVYCDSAVIAQALARHTGDTTLFAPGFAAYRSAEWADSQLFRVTVALNFGPEAIGAMMSQLSASDVEAFMKDRAELSKGAVMQSFSVTAARAYLDTYLNELESSLDAPFLFGDTPSIADFSLYHCLWFLDQNATNAPLLEPFGNVKDWMARMAAFGHGQREEATGEQALGHALECEPVLPDLSSVLPRGLQLGDRVDVTPADYGLVPVGGILRGCSAQEIVLEREAPEVGRVMTHFPAAGFEITQTSS
jgi:glutathione S-transferase